MYDENTILEEEFPVKDRHTRRLPREEKTKNYRRRCRGHFGDMSPYVLFREFGHSSFRNKYPIDKNYIDSICDGYRVKMINYHAKAMCNKA